MVRALVGRTVLVRHQHRVVLGFIRDLQHLSRHTVGPGIARPRVLLRKVVAQMPRKKETTIHREPAPDHDTAEQLMVTAWPYCGVIQDIIDRLNEIGSNTELR